MLLLLVTLELVIAQEPFLAIFTPPRGPTIELWSVTLVLACMEIDTPGAGKGAVATRERAVEAARSSGSRSGPTSEGNWERLNIGSSRLATPRGSM